MIAKFMAAWLVAIITLPFTAPLATCDIGDILHSGSTHAPAAPGAPAKPAADRSVSVPPVLSTDPGRLRLIVVRHTLVATARIADSFVSRHPARAWRPARMRPDSAQQRPILRI
jgi:hypothetical protein